MKMKSTDLTNDRYHYCQYCHRDLTGLHALQRFCPYKHGIPNYCKYQFHKIRLENRKLGKINLSNAFENNLEDNKLFFRKPRRVKNFGLLESALNRIKILETNNHYRTRDNISLEELIEDGAEFDTEQNFATLNGLKFKRKFLSNMYRLWQE